MSLPSGVTDVINTAIRARLDTGLKSLAWGFAIATSVAAGVALVLASALMGLAFLVGWALATGILGVGLLVAAALAATWDRRQRLVHQQQNPKPAPSVIVPQAAPSYLGFLLGFVTTRAILRQANQRRSP